MAIDVDISDPAWFYSSLAQVSAAIVGLIGAVLGTRLVSHIPDMRAALVSIHSRMSNVLDMLAARSTSYPRDFARVIDEAFLPRIRIAYQ
ncbi:MAG: hypothetical protein QN178_10505, partial [Armatimonadota bacterium]|nr:hypothetical protein [Armatimonadota bacterium]